MSASLLTVTLRVPNAMKSSMDYRHYFVALSCPYLIDSIQIQSPNYRSVGLFIVSISNKSLRSSAFSARGTTMEQLWMGTENSNCLFYVYLHLMQHISDIRPQHLFRHQKLEPRTDPQSKFQSVGEFKWHARPQSFPDAEPQPKFHSVGESKWHLRSSVLPWCQASAQVSICRIIQMARRSSVIPWCQASAQVSIRRRIQMARRTSILPWCRASIRVPIRQKVPAVSRSMNVWGYGRSKGMRHAWQNWDCWSLWHLDQKPIEGKVWWCKMMLVGGFNQNAMFQPRHLTRILMTMSSTSRGDNDKNVFF